MQPTPPPTSPTDGTPVGGGRRILAGVGAAALAIGALVLGVYALLVALVATRVPDAYYDGGDLSDPPETWGDAALAVGLAGVAMLVVFTVVALAVALAAVAAGGRPPAPRFLAIIAAVPPAVLVVALAFLLGSNAGGARLAVDCEEFRFDRAAFTSADPARWERQAFGLQDCEALLEGRSRARVQELLGPPDREILDGQRWDYKGDRLTVRFSGEGVERVRYRPDD